MKRLRPPGVAPIEVWDLPIEGRPLFAWQSDARFPEALARAARSLGASPARVVLTGGNARRAALPGAALTDDPSFFAARAGARLEGTRPLLVVDVGQSSIKLACSGRAWRVPRDLSRAPLRDGVPAPDRSAARASTLAFLADTLGAALRETGARACVLALPCEIDDRCVVSGCTYAWRSPDPELLPELARAARMPDSVRVLNDAELAASGVDPSPDGPVLVFTLGFGVGAAWRARGP